MFQSKEIKICRDREWVVPHRAGNPSTLEWPWRNHYSYCTWVDSISGGSPQLLQETENSSKPTQGFPYPLLLPGFDIFWKTSFNYCFGSYLLKSWSGTSSVDSAVLTFYLGLQLKLNVQNALAACTEICWSPSQAGEELICGMNKLMMLATAQHHRVLSRTLHPSKMCPGQRCHI